MNKAFHVHIGWLIEVYIDDMLGQTMEAGSLIDDVKTVFGCLRKHSMRLNIEIFVCCRSGEVLRLHAHASGHQGQTRPVQNNARNENLGHC